MKFFLNILFGVCTTISLSSGPFSFKELEKSGSVSLKDPSFLKSEDGLNLAYYPFCSRKETANLIFIHGGGTYSVPAYQKLARDLSANFKINTYLIDLRGHGKSEGARGDAATVVSVYSDIDNLISFVKKNSSKPVFIGGHSSGGGLLLNYFSHSKPTALKGIILLSPELGFRAKTNRDNIREQFAEPNLPVFILSGFTGKKLFGHTMAVKFNYPAEILKNYPMHLAGITTNMAYALTPENPAEQMKQFFLPVAIIIGEKDELIDPLKLKYFHDQIPEKNKSPFIVLPDEKHLSIIINSQKVIGNTILDWVK